MTSVAIRRSCAMLSKNVKITLSSEMTKMFRTCGTIMRLPFPLPNSCVCLPCLLMKYSWLYDRPHCLVLGIRAVLSSKKATKPAKVSDQMRIGIQTAPVRHGQYICHIADTDQYLTNAVPGSSLRSLHAPSITYIITLIIISHLQCGRMQASHDRQPWVDAKKCYTAAVRPIEHEDF